MCSLAQLPTIMSSSSMPRLLLLFYIYAYISEKNKYIRGIYTEKLAVFAMNRDLWEIDDI